MTNDEPPRFTYGLEAGGSPLGAGSLGLYDELGL